MSQFKATSNSRGSKDSILSSKGLKLLAKLEREGNNLLSWSPSGGVLALGSKTGEISIWDAATNIEKSSNIKDIYEDHVTCVAWSPDESQLAVGGCSDSQSVSIWNIKNGNLIRVFKEKHGEGVNDVVWCQRFILTSSADPYIRVWNPETGKLVNKLPLGISDKKIEHFDVNVSVKLSHDKQFIAVCGYNRDAIVCHANDLTEFHTIPLLRRGMATDLAWSPDGQRLAVLGMDRVVRIYDVLKRRIVDFVDTPAEEFSCHVNYSFDGRLLAIHFSYLKEHPVIARCDTYEIMADKFVATRILFSPTRPLLAISHPNTCEIYEFDTRLLLKMWPVSQGTDHISKPPDEALLPDGQKAVLATLAGRVLTAKEIGKELDTTEEAIRQQIRALRKMGYSIEQRRGAGYFLPNDPPT